MPVFNAKFFSIELASGTRTRDGNLRQTLDRAFKQQIRMAARAFVRVASASVPVRTGFARGVFRNVLEAAGALRGGGTAGGDVLSALQELRGSGFDTRRYPNIGKMFEFKKGGLRAAGAKGFRNEYYTGHGGRVLKLPQSGRRFATQAGQIFQESGGIYTFNFDVTITYFNINDFRKNPRTPSSPWQAFNRGRATFMNYIRTIALNRIPKVQDFFVEHEVNVSGSTIRKTRLGVISRGTRFRV